jgi:hypothetical protein
LTWFKISAWFTSSVVQLKRVFNRPVFKINVVIAVLRFVPLCNMQVAQFIHELFVARCKDTVERLRKEDSLEFENYVLSNYKGTPALHTMHAHKSQAPLYRSGNAGLAPMLPWLFLKC